MAKPSFTLRQRLRYRFDNAMVRGTTPVLAWLAAATAILVVVAGLVIWLLGWGPRDRDTPLLEGVWLSVTRSLDPGTFGGDEGAHFRLVGLTVSVAGIFILATVIGLVTTAIDRRLKELRKGRSLVVERHHTLILGWSPQVPGIVAELVEANRNQRQAAVVVLSALDAADAEHEIRIRVKDLRTTRLVVRSGDPCELTELQLTHPELAKSVIVVRPDGLAADARVVRVVMALRRCVTERGRLIPVVAELTDSELSDSLRTAATEMNLLIVEPYDVIGRITAQVARTPGLSAVFTDLLDFEGFEIYQWDVPRQLIGRKPMGKHCWRSLTPHWWVSARRTGRSSSAQTSLGGSPAQRRS